MASMVSGRASMIRPKDIAKSLPSYRLTEAPVNEQNKNTFVYLLHCLRRPLPVPARPAQPAIAALRAQIAALEGESSRDRAFLPFDVPELDARLPGGGLALGCLHEVAGGGSGALDGAAASRFAAGIAARLSGQVLWCVTEADVYAPGLEQAGLGPDRVIVVEAGDDVSVLACMEEGLPWRAGGCRGRGGTALDDRLAEAPPGRQGIRNNRHCAAAPAPGAGRLRFREAHCGDDALARHGSALGFPARSRHGTCPLARRTGPGKSGREHRYRAGGM